MNLLIHDLAAAIEREADDRSPRRARLHHAGDHLRPWDPAAPTRDARKQESSTESCAGDDRA